MTHRSSLVAVVTAVLCHGVPAQGPDPALMPADTTIVVHIDLQAIGRLIQFDKMREELRAGELRIMGQRADVPPEAAEVLDRIERDLGFEVARDLHSVTVFGNHTAKGDPSVMLMTSGRLDGMLEKLREEGVVRGERHDGIRFQRLHATRLAHALGFDEVDEDDDEGFYFYVREMGRRRAVLVGEKPGEMVSAARALAEGQPSRRRGRSGEGVILLAEISSLEEVLDDSPVSKVADRVEKLQLKIAEEQDDLVITAAVKTTSRDDARDVAAVVNGLRSLATLTNLFDEVPEALRGVVENARAEADGARVEVSARVPVATVHQLLHQRKSRKRAESKKRRRYVVH